MRPIVAHEVHKWERRERRAHSVGNSIIGTPERPRLSIYRSNRHFHSQLIDDTAGKTLVMVEHDMSVVFDLADRISVLVYGEIIATDTPARIHDNAAVQAAYLGTMPDA